MTVASNNPYPSILVVEQSSKPTAPAAGNQRLYMKTDHKLYHEDSGGTETEVGGGVAASGMVVQMKYAGYSATDSTTTPIPQDDTIPQNTEGKECMSLSITPQSASNIIIVDVTGVLSTTGGGWATLALFKDTNANAVAVAVTYIDTSTAIATIPLSYSETAGDTSSHTWHVRFGNNSANNCQFNGQSTVGRLYGATTKSSIKITEVKA